MAPTNGTATLSDLELVSQAKTGNLDAFGELVNRHERKIFRLTQHITGNREDAEDALQESFLKAFARLVSRDVDSVVIGAVDLGQRLDQVNGVAFITPKLRPNSMSIDCDPQSCIPNYFLAAEAWVSSPC